MRVCYMCCMNDNYIRTATTVSLIHYHFVFCPRYRRKIFLIPGVEDRFKKLTEEVCAAHDIRIIAMECHVDHVHLFLNCLPTQSPADVMKWVKGASSHKIRAEFQVLGALPSLWTRSYFVSTAGNVSSATVKKYVDSQKTSSYIKKKR